MISGRPTAGQSPVWITGASSGLGRALARQLAGQGRTVVASARSADRLDALAAEAAGLPGRVATWPLDITDRAAVAEAVAGIEAAHGPIAQAVLNAGTHRPTPAAGFSSADLRALVELNVFGTAHCLEALMPVLSARRCGRIAVVASMAGWCGLPTAGGYALTKGGLVRLCEALRPELARRGVVLQVVSPGFVRTPLTDRNDFAMPFLMEPDAAAAAFPGLQPRADRRDLVVAPGQGRRLAIEAQHVAQQAPGARPQQVAALGEQAARAAGVLEGAPPVRRGRREGEGHVRRRGLDPQRVEQPDQVRIVALVVDDEAGVDGDAPPATSSSTVLAWPPGRSAAS
ncbi:Short-chain dehydrogenase [Tistlia consotensis]|uniref:Short-chain dehydrogenase n=1 Tax=Tistlia consotensis USBA 355 TaxID=560819 RepID=A0A1Y6CBH8_9PROT|nr:SDR family NAD(P)-dependent oxidoreductase [Tistlia consotensis]SMF53507.1 Short-chain dehydrogenase [Tistlia consotensis USBA 355]SNR85626.1 Short-chain dehydrogenase [Tistlia consotensis]